MKMFLSWSGDLSNEIAHIFEEYLPKFIQTIEPWISDKDIKHGNPWFSEITDSLSEMDYAIVFLTKSNYNKPWLLFEIGALNNKFKQQNVFPILIDIERGYLPPPIGNYQSEKIEKDKILKLLQLINSRSNSQIKDKILEEAFENNWGKFEIEIQEILNKYNNLEESISIPTEESISNNILNTILNKIDILSSKVESLERSNNSIRVIKPSLDIAPNVVLQTRNSSNLSSGNGWETFKKNEPTTIINNSREKGNAVPFNGNVDF